jgi:Putative peptidoglycan binding domain
MKTKFYWVALLASAALIAQAKAGGYHGNGGHFAGPRSVPSIHSAPVRNFGGGRMNYSGQRFSSVGRQLPSSAALSHYYMNSNRGASPRTSQFTHGNINHGDRLPRFSNGTRPAIANSGREENRAGQVRSRSSLPANWRNHIVAQHSGDWHRDWDRTRDHRWHGHSCRFINGSWVIFDLGFYPDSYSYHGYDYASDYSADPYGSDYASDYSADPNGYDSTNDSSIYQGEENDETGSAGQVTDSTIVADAQEQLTRRGYYRGAIDGILGQETRRAIIRYQSDHGLTVTGRLNTDMLHALGLPRVASN